MVIQGPELMNALDILHSFQHIILLVIHASFQNCKSCTTKVKGIQLACLNSFSKNSVFLMDITDIKKTLFSLFHQYFWCIF